MSWEVFAEGAALGLGARKVRAPRGWSEAAWQLAGAASAVAFTATMNGLKARFAAEAQRLQQPPPPAAPAQPRARRVDPRVVAAARLLGVKLGASEAEIQAAFHKAMRSAHPDAGGQAWYARRVIDARDLLRDRARRRDRR